MEVGSYVLVTGPVTVIVAVTVRVTVADKDGGEVLEQLPVELTVGVAVTVPLGDFVDVSVEDVVVEEERVVV